MKISSCYGLRYDINNELHNRKLGALRNKKETAPIVHVIALDGDDDVLDVTSLVSRFKRRRSNTAYPRIYGILKVWDGYGVSMSAVSSQPCFSRKNQTVRS
ncbi:hypothetical protein Tco_1087247 [Tanacetum coccineum]